MFLSARNRVPSLLVVIAVVLLVLAMFMRPQPLPAGVVRDQARRVKPQAALAGRTYGFVVFVGDRRVTVTSTPIAVSDGETISIVGWALDWRTNKPGASMLVEIDDRKPESVTDYRLARPDVAATLHDADAASSGFQVRVPLAGFAAGLHRIHFSVVGADGSVSVLPTDVPITVESGLSR